MTERKQLKYQDIPFLIDGTMRIVKSVTRYTTCNDVISKLPKLHTPLSVYESVDGVEKRLSGKAKLLKIWRAHGPSRKVVFVVRKVEQIAKTKTHRRGLFGVRKKCENSVISTHVKQVPTAKDQLKQVSDLAFYVRYQKSKIQAINRKSSHLMDNTSDDVEKNIMTRITSNASVTSMDAFLAKADLDNMAHILSFCGQVTEEKLRGNETQKTNCKTAANNMTADVATNATSAAKINKNTIQQSLKTLKIGLKQKFTSKSKTASRSTSIGTIGSTDTGYHSVTSGSRGQPFANENSGTRARIAGIPKRHTFIDADMDGVPRHSTPVIGHSLKRKVDDLENTLSMPSLDSFDETDGKNFILQKFMADQTLVEDRMSGMTDSGKLTAHITERKRRRTDRHSLPAFTTQEEKCRFYWNSNCDSDSDSCCDSDVSGDHSKLDEAFVDSCVGAAEFITPRNRTLRRDSAISNLTKFSLIAKSINFDESGNKFDYSFNCTFPRMDESQSVNFSFSFDDSDSGEDLSASSSDESMDSFMKTSILNFDSDEEVEEAKTKVFECESGDDKSDADSDEGLGSMTSGSVSDFREMLI